MHRPTRRALWLAPVAMVALAACGSGSSDDTAEAESPATSDAPTTTIGVEDNLLDAYKQCAGNNITAEYGERYAEVGSIYRGVFKKVAKEQGKTENQVVGGLLAEVYNADEDTITIGGAYDNDSEYGMSETGLLLGIVYDCLLTSLDVPERVLDHIGTTRALDGQQEDTWDDYNARWTYHPDNGVNLTIWTED